MEGLAASAIPPVLVQNGCWSGTPVSRYGQDPFSLAVRGMLGGANSVVAGTRQIGGVASAHVASRLVGLLAGGGAVTSRLRRVQLEIPDAHPELGHND